MTTRAHRLTVTLAIGLIFGACSDDPAPAAGAGGVADTAQEDVVIWADVSKDTWSPIIDTRAPADTGPADIPSKPDVPKDAAELPKPATVPTDLPPGIVAIGVSSSQLEEDGDSPTVKVTLPDGTSAFSVVMLGQHPGHFSIATAVNPKGDILGKGICSALCLACQNRLGGTPATGTALFPSSSGVTVLGGAWHLSTCGFAWTQTGSQFSRVAAKGQQVDTVVFARTGAVPSKGRLKVRLWFAGAKVNAAKSFDDPLVVGMLQAGGAAMASAGITLDVLDRIDVPTGFAQLAVPAGLTTDHSSAADALFAHAAKVGGSAVLDVFVVDKLGGDEEGGELMAGWSGGTPGPTFYPGRPRAGVVIAYDNNADGPTAGRRLAHEIGHYLGLWHTTSAGGAHDPIDDTAACTSAQDADMDGVLSAVECVGLDGGNVMFWSTGAGGGTFSAEQSAIMRGNPLVWAVAP